MKPSELPGARRLYRLTNRALAQIRELWQYAGEDELPPDSVLQAQVEAFRILHVDVPLSAKRQFQLFCSEHFPGLADILDCLAADQLWALLSMRAAPQHPNRTTFALEAQADHRQLAGGRDLHPGEKQTALPAPPLRPDRHYPLNTAPAT